MSWSDLSLSSNINPILDPTWQAMQVVLSERVTGCIVAREALVRTAVDSTGKISTLEEALKGLQALHAS